MCWNISARRARYILSGTAFVLFIGLVLIIGAGLLSGALIIFAIGWGATAPSGKYAVDLKLEGGEAISGLWIAQSGDEYVLQVGEEIVAVRAAKVISRTFH